MDGRADQAYLPIPEGAVTGFSGTLAQDSSLSQRGDTVLRVSLRGVSSARTGIAATARGLALIFVTGDYRFSMGEILSFRAGLTRYDGQGAETFVGRAGRAEVARSGYAGRIWQARAEAREWLHRAVSEAGYPASALMDALLVGSREDVPAALNEGFQRTGSLHILALSGLHVSVIYGLLSGLLGFLRGRLPKFLAATAVLLFYQFLAGFMPSLLRATAMILAGGIGLLLDRDAEPINLLAISGIGILLADPFQAFSLSFQLSYLALAGILAIGPLVKRPLEGLVPPVLLAPLALSIGAQAATLPLVVARFGVYYPSGLVASLVLVPLTTLFLWCGLAWLPLSAVPWPFLHEAGARVFGALYAAIDGSARLLARLPGVMVGRDATPWVVGASTLLLLAAGSFLPARRAIPVAAR